MDRLRAWLSLELGALRHPIDMQYGQALAQKRLANWRRYVAVRAVRDLALIALAVARPLLDPELGLRTLSRVVGVAILVASYVHLRVRHETVAEGQMPPRRRLDEYARGSRPIPRWTIVIAGTTVVAVMFLIQTGEIVPGIIIGLVAGVTFALLPPKLVGESEVSPDSLLPLSDQRGDQTPAHPSPDDQN